MKLRAAFLFAGFSILAMLAVAPAAGAAAAPHGASTLGKVTVSNAAPLRQSVIEVSSTGWLPHELVSVTMSGVRGALASATADATGAVHTQVSIPAGAPIGFDVLAVSGSTAGGVPQEIVTGLSVVKAGHPARRVTPWTAVFALAFLATLVMLASQKLMSRDSQVANPVATT